VGKLDKLQDEDLSPQPSDVKRPPSGDQSLEYQGKHPQQASGATEKGATPSHDRDIDQKCIEHLQVVEGLHPELLLNGLRDVRVAVQHGRIAELRTQRDVERAFEQARIEVIDEQLRMAGMKARGRQYQSLLLLGLLISLGALVAGSVYSDRLADSQVFWAIAGTVFFMSCAAIIIFAAAALGAFAEMMQLVRTQFRSTGRPSAEVTTADPGSTLSIDEIRNKYGQDE
jgi:hypothetical protein